MDKNIKRFFLLSLLVLLLLGASYATETGNDTADTQEVVKDSEATTNTVDNDIYEEKIINKEVAKKNIQEQDTKTVEESYSASVKRYTELVSQIEDAKSRACLNYTINLKKGNYNATSNLTWGDSDFATKLVINANGITLDGNDNYHFMAVKPNYTLTINDAVLTNFKDKYGGVISGDTDSIIEITNSVFKNNITNYEDGTLSINLSKLLKSNNNSSITDSIKSLIPSSGIINTTSDKYTELTNLIKDEYSKLINNSSTFNNKYGGTIAININYENNNRTKNYNYTGSIGEKDGSIIYNGSAYEDLDYTAYLKNIINTTGKIVIRGTVTIQSNIIDSKKETTLYIYPRSGDTKGTTIRVSGKLLDTENKGIKGQNIQIKVNDKTYTATTTSTGYFTTNHTITDYNDMQITYTYKGNSEYKSATNTTTYTVQKPVTLYMYPRSGDKIGTTIKVSGKLLTADNQGIRQQKIQIKVNDKTYTATTSNTGYFTVNYTITDDKDLKVTFTYNGNKKYEAAANTTIYTVQKPVTLFMYQRSNDEVGTTIRVSGKLLTNDNKGIKGQTIQIKVNKKTYTATTTSTGYFTVNYTITDYNNIKVTFTYNGNEHYSPATNTTTYTVIAKKE